MIGSAHYALMSFGPSGRGTEPENPWVVVGRKKRKRVYLKTWTAGGAVFTSVFGKAHKFETEKRAKKIARGLYSPIKLKVKHRGDLKFPRRKPSENATEGNSDAHN